jgi:MoaA/NifB/PqqE/SkfB family radical SAM enzyme
MADTQLKNNSTFCILPFVHSHVNTDGEVYPCCVGWTPDKKTSLGKLSESSIEELFNSDAMKQLRVDLLNGKRREDFCDACYQREDNGFPSARIGNNQDFEYDVDNIVSSMESDGTLKPNIRSWDIRYSNLCNLKCRSCGDLYSTSWSIENGKLVEYKAFTDGTDPLEKQYEHIEKIYFAGGEPLIMPEHFASLTKLIESGRASKVKLVYNSNMTKLNYNGHDLLKYWKEFRNVTVGMSIDAIGERAEYIRNGFKWYKIEDNLKKFSEFVKGHDNINYYYSPTISLMSVYNLTDMHQYLFEKGYMKTVNDFLFNILIHPDYYNVRLLPKKIKNEIQEKISTHLVWLKSKNCNESLLEQYLNLYSYLNEDIDKNLQTQFYIKTKELDNKRNENFSQTFPEYSEWWESIEKSCIAYG